jgi:putative nucleotidyltransferase with HDIG domain
MAATAIDNIEVNKEVQKYINGTIRALIATVEAKDEWALGHAARVGRYALMMAKEMNLPKDDIRQLEYLALLHDIGMIGVPESLLKRKGQLTSEEWVTLRRHTEIGANIVNAIEFIKDGAKVIKHHHEWYNGAGYPDGLKGEAIPFFSRIIAVAEAFDSMTSTTCYREPVELTAAIVELKTHAGKQFDPELVAIFLAALKKEKTF